jgi:hypothetical protein
MRGEPPRSILAGSWWQVLASRVRSRVVTPVHDQTHLGTPKQLQDELLALLQGVLDDGQSTVSVSGLQRPLRRRQARHDRVVDLDGVLLTSRREIETASLVVSQPQLVDRVDEQATQQQHRRHAGGPPEG